MAEKTIKKPFRELVKEHLERNGTKQTWLATNTKISDTHISNILAGRVLITEEVRAKINAALGTDY